MEMAKDAIGIKNYKTYSKTFEDLIEWGFIRLLQRSKNQYSSNIIAIVKNTKAHTKALSKATQKHSQKQVHGIVGIDKQIQTDTEPITREQENIELDVNIWINGFEFLKQDGIWYEREIEMKFNLSEPELNHRLEQYWLSLQKSNFKGQLNQIRAGFVKWLKTWNEKEKNNGKQTRKGHNIEGISDAADKVLRDYKNNLDSAGDRQSDSDTGGIEKRA